MQRSCVAIILISILVVLLPTVFGFRETAASRRDAEMQFGGDGRRFLLDAGESVLETGSPQARSNELRGFLAEIGRSCRPFTDLGSSGSGACSKDALVAAAELQDLVVTTVMGRELPFLAGPSADRIFVEMEDGSVLLYVDSDNVYVELIDPLRGRVLYRRVQFEFDWTGTLHAVSPRPSSAGGLE